MNLKSLTALIATFMLCFGCAIVEDNQLTEKEKAENWQLLFDGQSISEQWTNFQSDKVSNKWVIKDGTFGVAEASGEAGDIVTKEQYKDFEFKIDWKVGAKGNSGIFLRCDDTDKKSHARSHS